MPIPFLLNFQEIPVDTLASVFHEFLKNPDIKSTIARRNRDFLATQRLRDGSSECNALVKRYSKTDERLAMQLLGILAAKTSEMRDRVDTISFSDILAHYVDYSKPGNKERVDHLAANLDKMTFLADFLESIVTDIKGDMDALFGNDIRFEQFDAVLSTLKQLQGFSNSTRNEGEGTKDTRTLYMEYADSINAYLDKRLKTYTDRYRRIAPDRSKPVIRTKQEVMTALNAFFHTEFLADMTCKSMNGGYDADYMKLVMNLTPRQTEYLDRHVALPEQEPDNLRKYNRTLTEILFNRRKWKKW